MKKLLFLVLLSSSLCHADTVDFLKSCFKDYVVSMSKGSSEATLGAIRKRCLSKRFNENWRKLVTSSDADAMLLSQDSLESWKSDVEVKSLDKVRSSATVILGTHDEIKCLRVTFMNEASGEKISSVNECPTK